MRAAPLLALVCLTAPAAAAAAPALTTLQAMVDATPEGGALRPPAGAYAGPIVVKRAMTLDGSEGVVIDGEGVGTVLTINASHVTIEHLALRNSGQRHENLDACLRIEKAGFNVVRDNALDGCLVGVDLREAEGNVIRRNAIRGREPDLDIRGDGIRVWRSDGNRFEDNVVVDHRDVLFEYSTRNVFSGNSVANGRYGTHFMYASGNLAKGNVYAYNTVGLFSMYSDDLCLIDNRVTRGNGPAGIGVGLKEASGAIVENNEILGNAIGLYIDGSPFDPDRANTFRGNRWAFNALAIEFHANTPGNAFEGNAFLHNYTDVAAQGGQGATAPQWRGNYWDAYEGFDRRGRGVGDTPFEIQSYADQLWSDAPMTAFYRGSPVFETIDFLARLAPFSPPRLILRDEAPVTAPPPLAAPTCGAPR